jgi:Putative death-receptor fusion protein (DUF2428)
MLHAYLHNTFTNTFTTPLKQQFLLRRSGGFASAFQALLRAEPRNCPPQLLPRAMQRLLELARPTAPPTPPTAAPAPAVTAAAAALETVNGSSSSSAVEYDTGAVFDSDDVWRAQVHSLNVLRLVFIDSALAADVAQYISAALMVRCVLMQSCLLF